MTVPKFFNVPSSAAVPSYDFIDFQEGTGLATFYGVQSKNNATTNYNLVSSTGIYSWNISTTFTDTVDGDYQKGLDLDFDLEFNKAKQLKGNFNISVPMRVVASGSNARFYSIVTVRHWDGSTETDLGSSGGVNANSLRTTINGNTKYYMDQHLINISNLTFKKGETLRITIEIWYQIDGGGTPSTYHLGHDPANRDSDDQIDWSGNTTQLTVQVPFVIN